MGKAGNIAADLCERRLESLMEERSILIADDETNLCRILSAELRKAGYLVTAVHDGARAIEQFTESDYQMVILDVRMPVLDGFSALREIRKIKKEVPVIIMTAYEGHDTAASALSMGATACVSKPFDLESLVALVKATLDAGNSRNSVDWTGRIRTVLFNKNQPVLLEVHEGDGAGDYQSTIEDKDAQTLAVACPAYNGGYLTVRTGAPVTIGFAGEDAFYRFDTSVLATRDSVIPVMIVSKPALIYRIQRRKYPRALARIEVDLELVDDETSYDGCRVFTEDIGAGGCRIISDNELPDGAQVNINAVDVPGIARFAGMGKITRARRAPINSHLGWEYGVQFTKVEDHVRRALRHMVESKALE